MAFLSDHATRVVQLPWSIQYTSGRALCAQFAVGSLNILGASLYLPPSGPTYGSTRKLADDFLQVISEELVYGSSGLRFICGDFNRNSYELHAFLAWRQAGWEEVQSIALKRFLRPMTPTSKAAAYSDQLWVSPELAAYLVEVHTLEEIFSEHDPLYATFRLPTGHLHQWHWPQPTCFPWTSIPPGLSCPVDFPAMDFWQDSTKAFASWSSAVEHSIADHCAAHDVCLPRGHLGRGQTIHPHKRPIQLCPIASGRHGDDVPQSGLLNRSVHQWFKQLRRLQAYVQRSRAPQFGGSVQVDQLFTWKKILHAPGFRRSFSSWWPSRLVQLQGSPTCIPPFPPDGPTAEAIYMDFRANYRRYEQWQFSRRKSLLQAQAHDHCKILYKQLKQADFSPPEWFTLHFETLIATVHDCDAELVDPLTLPVTASWTLQGSPVHLEILEPTRVRLTSDLIPVPGQLLRGTLRVSDFSSMEAALDATWQPIWNRHLETTPERWSRATAFMNAYLPAYPFDTVQWTGNKVDGILQKYKKHTATGPDGWSRMDLAHLPSDQHQQIAQLFDMLQHGLPWPEQLVVGFLCPVRKICEAERPTDYRPIILMSMVYRLWAAGVSRSLLPGLAALCGPHIYGFLPGQRATDLWFLVQVAVEQALTSNSSFGGFNLDLIKCFNRLPRAPLFHGLRCLGVHTDLISTWQRALESLQRRFRIGLDTGPGHTSVTGFPEGDPLSCCIMLTFNLIMDKYMAIYDGASLLTSFVDNIQVLADQPGSIQQGRLVAEVFLTMLDLDLDPGKSYAWGTTPSFRSTLRAYGLPVKLAARDLGAQMTFSHVTWNHSGATRVQSIAHIWGILKRSPVHSWFKIRAICAAAWPKALHGIENRPMPKNALAKLRTQALNALGWRHAGCSPWIRWTLMQIPEADPEYFQIWNILRTFFRMMMNFPHLRVAWATGQGPFHAMQDVLALLGWHWSADLTLDLGFIQLRLDQLHLGLLRKLLLRAWDQYVVQQLSHRKDFADLSSIDRVASFSRPDLDPGDRALLATLQDGTFFTSWQIAKFDATRLPFCTQCQVEDDLQHRCLTCPLYEHIRRGHAAMVGLWNPATPSLCLHGLLGENEQLLPWWSYLHRLSNKLDDYVWNFDHSDELDFFTDGSCFDPRGPTARAAWAVVCQQHSAIVSAACLTGIVQTVNRAVNFQQYCQL